MQAYPGIRPNCVGSTVDVSHMTTILALSAADLSHGIAALPGAINTLPVALWEVVDICSSEVEFSYA